jgi:3-hydroxyacyl-CoA dehydrogenase
VVSRLFVPYLKEAFWLLEEGADPWAVDQAMVEFGFPMGPFLLIDMTGLDILALTDRILTEAFPRHGPFPPIATRLVQAGCLGQKTGSGVYDYEKGDRTPHESERTRQIMNAVRQEKNLTPRQVNPQEISERLLLRMIGEALCLVEEGVAQRDADVDVATVLGLGFPDSQGGLLRYAHNLGLDTIHARMKTLAEKCGDRYLPSERLCNRKGDA